MRSSNVNSVIIPRLLFNFIIATLLEKTEIIWLQATEHKVYFFSYNIFICIHLILKCVWLLRVNSMRCTVYNYKITEWDFHSMTLMSLCPILFYGKLPFRYTSYLACTKLSRQCIDPEDIQANVNQYPCDNCLS